MVTISHPRKHIFPEAERQDRVRTNFDYLHGRGAGYAPHTRRGSTWFRWYSRGTESAPASTTSPRTG